MKTYHGADPASINVICQGGIDVAVGGGELGRGFYTGEFLHEAKTWAFHKTRSRSNNVAEIDTPDTEVENLNVRFMTHSEAGSQRCRIRRERSTRTHTYGVDMVWAPIVGTDRVKGEQCKWESVDSQALLNGPNCQRSVV